MTSQKRAKVGGEVGINGEHYPAGSFICTTTLTKVAKAQKKAATRKVEIAPYVWEASPEGKSSIYRQFAGVFGKVIDGVAVFCASEQTLAYYGTTKEQAEALVSRWNAGERWL